MTSLQEIWDLSLNDIKNFIKDQKISTQYLSDLDLYFLTFDLKSDQLSDEDRDIIQDPLFEEILGNLSSLSHSDQLNRGLQLYNQLKNNPEKLKEKLKERNPKCKFNDFDQYNNPIDEIKMKSIQKNNVYVLGERCYDKNTIRNLLTSTKKDPITNKVIDESVYRDLGVPYENENSNILELALRNRNITSEQLRNYNFPPDLKFLILNNNPITSLLDVNFPLNLIRLYLRNNQISSLLNVNFPPDLQGLYLKNNQITSLLNVNFPPNLIELDLGDNQITSLLNVKFPSNLKKLYIQNNQITSLSNVKFPPNLKMLDLANNQINITQIAKIKDIYKDLKIVSDYSDKDIEDEITDLTNPFNLRLF